MKSFLSKFVLLLIFVSPYTQAQILNGDFEQWSGGEPDYWYTSNNPLCSPGAVNVFQTSNAYSGNSAVYGKITSVYDTCGKGPGEHYPSISTYGWVSNDIIGFAISGRPKQMRIHYIYKPVGEGGGFSATVYLSRWDFSKGERVVVGTGGFLIFNTFFLDTTKYTEHVSAMNYFYDEDPDTIIISFGLLDNDVGTEFYLDDISLSFMQITSPSENDVIISGEKDTIKWDAGTGNIKIMYSLDNGNSYTTIENSYPADSSKYIWDVPDDLLSAKAKIRIEDMQDNTQYDEKSVYIKPWQLTRIDANGDFDLFEPNKNGWSFCNCSSNVWPLSWWEQFGYYDGIDPNTGEKYPHREPFISALNDDFPDWPIFVDAFGVTNCYLGDSAYNSRAVTLWEGVKGLWGGSCEGFAVTSLLYFYHENYMSLVYPNVGDLQNVNSASINNDVRKVINKYFTQQFGDPYKKDGDDKWLTLDARQTLQELKDLFSKNNKDAPPLEIYKKVGSGGHAVTPYKLERIGNSSKFNLWVYDSNNPNATNRGIIFDSVADKRTENTGLGWGSDSTKCYLALNSSEHLFNIHLPGEAGFLAPRPVTSKKLGNQDLNLNIYNTSNAEIMIQNSKGTIGYEDSLVVNTFPDARPIIPKTGTVHPPIGYSLTQGDYSVQINNFTDSSSHIFFMNESTIYNYRRHDAAPNQKDIFNFSNGLGIENIDQASKKINLETIIEEDSSEKVFVADMLQISKDDSIHINELDRNKLVFKNFGSAKSYNLQVRSANPTEAQEFNHGNISIANNSSHQIVPVWNKLEIEPVKILIDNGNDGSIDDSMFVSNELTGAIDLFKNNNPNEFHLYQNYPNPFNPTTKIKYSIPSLGTSLMKLVQLKVYDVLGREVAILVNKQQQPGNYEVAFDASTLSSGVYFYTLRTGGFIKTKKMLLLK